MTHSELPEGSANTISIPLCTDDMCRAFWSSVPKKKREKWETRLKGELSSKRQFQLIRHMTEYFAKQEGPMQDVAKQKLEEFKKQLEGCEQEIQRCEQALGGLRASREQLRGAIEGLKRVFKAAGLDKPDLKLVPAVPETPQLVLNPEPTEPTPPATPDPELA